MSGSVKKIVGNPQQNVSTEKAVLLKKEIGATKPKDVGASAASTSLQVGEQHRTASILMETHRPKKKTNYFHRHYCFKPPLVNQKVYAMYTDMLTPWWPAKVLDISTKGKV